MTLAFEPKWPVRPSRRGTMCRRCQTIPDRYLSTFSQENQLVEPSVDVPTPQVGNVAAFHAAHGSAPCASRAQPLPFGVSQNPWVATVPAGRVSHALFFSFSAVRSCFDARLACLVRVMEHETTTTVMGSVLIGEELPHTGELNHALSPGRGGSSERHHGKYFAECTLDVGETSIAEPYETTRCKGDDPGSCFVAVTAGAMRARWRGLAGIGIRRRLEV